MYSPGFFPNGYLGKPFNGGYYQVLALGQRYGFDPHTTPWNEMTPEAQQAFLFGAEREVDRHLPQPDRADEHCTRRNSPAFTASSAIGMWAAPTPIRSLARRAAGRACGPNTWR